MCFEGEGTRSQEGSVRGMAGVMWQVTARQHLPTEAMRKAQLCRPGTLLPCEDAPCKHSMRELACVKA